MWRMCARRWPSARPNTIPAFPSTLMPRTSRAAASPGIDLIVFDCDGVLVDSEVLACRAIAALDTVLPRLALARCVASSSLPDDILWKLQRTDLLRWFSPAAVFSTALVAHGKPAPDIFLYAAAQMGAAPERSIAIEDSMP